MDIRSALAAYRAIQAGLKISEPIEAGITKAWPYWPPKSAAMPAMPCFINEWKLVKEDRTTNGVREQYYSIHSQLLISDAQEDRAADIASAFMPELVDALDATLTLNGAVSWSDLRGGDPTLFTAHWNGRSFVGLDLFLDVRLTEGKTYGQ